MPTSYSIIDYNIKWPAGLNGRDNSCRESIQWPLSECCSLFNVIHNVAQNKSFKEKLFPMQKTAHSRAQLKAMCVPDFRTPLVLQDFSTPQRQILAPFPTALHCYPCKTSERPLIVCSAP